MRTASFRVISVLGASVVALVLASPLQAGHGDDMAGKIAAAKTAADHEAIAAGYEEMQKESKAAADRHARMAEAYGKIGGGLVAKQQLQKHCEALAKRHQADATTYGALAEAHREAAKQEKSPQP